ncbi:hypothetical protein DL93DRAFT_2081651 [Clavulina sp. PMI_390]|nr:hypothetical protein DL93DRAFT_2081651 [Clavulina sp. PMI_390]
MLQIDTLPVELLQSIFLFATDNHQSKSSYVGFPARLEHLTPALTLTYVCSRWRSISLAMGRLWSHVVVFFSDSTAQELLMLTWQLERAGSCPLHVTVDTSGRFDRGGRSRSWEFIQHHLPRSQTLFFPNLEMTLHDFIFPLPGQFPRLKRITVRLASRHTLGLKASLFASATSVPSLESLDLRNPHAAMFNTIPLPQLNSIRFSSLGTLDLHSIYDLLRKCSALTHLFFPSPRGRYEVPSPFSPIILPQLSSLTVNDCKLDEEESQSTLRDLVTILAARPGLQVLVPAEAVSQWEMQLIDIPDHLRNRILVL